eukprot:scaffold143_cov173-Ochromonas_danica.AAC.27
MTSTCDIWRWFMRTKAFFYAKFTLKTCVSVEAPRAETRDLLRNSRPFEKLATFWAPTELPGDILHNLHSEWLEWKDLSRLDIACAGKRVREMAGRPQGVLSGWVCCEVECHRRSYGSVRHGVLLQAENNLSVFLSHFHNLQAVTTPRMNDVSRYTEQLCDVILSILVEKLREDSLVKICLSGVLGRHESHVMVTKLITKHASSLKELSIFIRDGIDIITSTLIKNLIRLRALATFLGVSFLSYLSSAGDLLEELEELTISTCGWESLVAVSKHSCLSVVSLTMAESASVDMLDGLLLDEKMKWPPTLDKGSNLVTGPNKGCKTPPNTDLPQPDGIFRALCDDFH